MSATKTCKRCGETLELEDFTPEKRNRDGLTSRCRACTAEVKAAYRAANRSRIREVNRTYRQERADLEAKAGWHRAYRERNPEKRRAHSKVAYAVRRGDLVRPDACDACLTAGDVHAHHDDYAKPLAVRWLCHACHVKEHWEALA